jgi:BirA family biotin operon repressor/biotin-[acetyl-CoA-carboxylase] ligase
VTSSAERILARLRASETPVSGEELAAALGISRAAVFKQVEALRGRGYAIDAEHAQGYVLRRTPDRLDATELGPQLTGTWRHVVWREEVDSTQRLARELAREGAPEGTIVIAEMQAAGRGRLGRTWHSPAGVNLYCSILLRPALAPAAVPQLALVVGLAVAETIESLGLRPLLKWPNDVLLDGRKAVGILTEMEAELERVHVVIVGIGVNVNATARELPPYLRGKATSLAVATGHAVDRVRFTADTIATVERWYRRFLAGGFAPLRPEWERRSALAGQRVTIAAPDGTIAGTAVGLDDTGALRIRDQAGTVHRVLAGEVTVVGGYPA